MKPDGQISLSVVVPVYNEEENVASLHAQIVRTCEAGMDGIPFDYEIIFVNDGSKDRTDAVCRTLSPLTLVTFCRNYGQTAALDCGFKMARGEFVAALDGDGQNDPADIPAMIRYLLDNDLDVVSGWRKDRKDSFGKRFASRGANVLRHMMIHDGIHDSGCTLKIYRRSCLEGLTLFGEQHRFIPALLKIRGCRIGEMPVRHRAREHGKTKYGLSRIVKGFLDMVAVWFWNKFAARPLHLYGGAGLLCLACGLAAGIVALVLLIGGWGDPAAAGIIAFVLLLGSLILLGMGMMCEMMVRIYYKDGVPYRVLRTETFAEGADEDTAGHA